MKRFVTRSAWKEASKHRIGPDLLAKASDRTNQGLVDAEIGARLFKQRIGRKGDFRIILYLERDRRSVVLHMFPKNVQPNISGHELRTLRDFANLLADLDDESFVKLARERGWKDISDDENRKSLSKRPSSIDP